MSDERLDLDGFDEEVLHYRAAETVSNGGHVNLDPGDKGSNNLNAEDEGLLGPACQSCRKKKTRCSRKQPCSNCVQLDVECSYEGWKLKPGLRKGAVKNLNQRLVELENMFLGQGILWEQVWNAIHQIQDQARTPPSKRGRENPTGWDGNLQDRTSRFRDLVSDSSSTYRFDEGPRSGQKRQRCSNDRLRPHPSSRQSQFALRSSDEDLILPPAPVMDELVNLYFENFQPWIPVLHMRRFRERMADAEKRKSLETIFHAIISVCVRFCKSPHFETPAIRAEYAKRSKQKVILDSMESFSVENLQALVIVTLDTIGSGRGPSAWSIVGSMTRTVEHLQVSKEDEDEDEDDNEHNIAQFLIQKMAFLEPPRDWIQKEERRRVFWNVFLMDRFCSIATGWDLSLPSSNIHRRLPCHGPLWQKEIPLNAPTPYFGVTDTVTQDPLPQKSMPDSPSEQQQPRIAGFAYRIEATENLSLVSRFFLKHPVNGSNARDLQIWMMRFKELDLRLIHWKVMLPEMWREAAIFNENGVMDENLSLAHVTHNTAVILLHQSIAYPSSQWLISSIRLPSGSSAETCFAAASETSIIAERFLHSSTGVVAPEFAFCLFVTARMLLSHARHHKTAFPTELETLTSSLLEISRRWKGQQDSGPDAENLASKFAARLLHARDRGPEATVEQPSLDLRAVVYCEEDSPSAGPTSAVESPVISLSEDKRDSSAFNQNSAPIITPYFSTTDQTLKRSTTGGRQRGQATTLGQTQHTPAEISLAFPPLPPSFQRDESFGAGHVRTTQLTDALDYGSGELGGFQTASAVGDPRADMNITAGGSNYQDLEDLNSFFDVDFPPLQRISAFSRTGNWTSRSHNQSEGL